MARLEIHYGDDRVVNVELKKPEVVIGRDGTCDVALEDSVTSRRHARLHRDAWGEYWLQDLRSKNGTTVNDRPITLAQVRDGDRIGIGGCRLVLRTEAVPTVVLGDFTPNGEAIRASSWGADQELDLPKRRLQALYEFNQRLTGRFDRDDLLGELLNMCAESLRFERAGIAVWQGPGHPPHWIKLVDMRARASSGELCVSSSIVDRTLCKGERVLINDTMTADPTASMVSNNILSAMCVPMEYLQRVRGVIYGDRVTTTGGYAKEDIDFFAALGRLGAMGLANVQLVEELRHRQQVETQFAMARQIQAHLLPSEPLRHGRVLIEAMYEPGQRVSGDYFDYFLREDGRIALVIADVAGKGVPASLLMANLQAAVHLTMAESTDLPWAVERLNRLVCHNAAEARFITAVFGLLDPVDGVLTCVNAGHPAPYLLDAAGVRKLATEPGLPLGVEAEFHYQAQRIELKDSPAMLFFFTDGVTEAENVHGAQFREERLAATLEAHADQPPADLLVAVRASIQQFAAEQPQSDDITMLTVLFS